MRVAITGEFLRPGQEGNIAWLWEVLRRYFPHPEIVTEEPLQFQDWVATRLLDNGRYIRAFKPYDLVVGFELHEGALACAKRYVNIRRHPFRWTGLPMWCIQTSFPVTLPQVGFLLPSVKPVPGYEGVCFTTQVGSDASMLHGTSFVTPGDVWPKVEEVARNTPTLWVCPHPLERDGFWVQSLLLFPNAKLWPFSTYQALASLHHVYTISSSTGWEAPYFGCLPTFLHPGGPPTFGPPRDIGDPNLWQEIRRVLQ